jgi:hypothetical protein
MVMDERELRRAVFDVLRDVESGTEMLCPCCHSVAPEGLDEHRADCALAQLLYVELKDFWFPSEVY